VIDILAYNHQTRTYLADLTCQDVPRLLADPAVYLWVDFDQPTHDESQQLSTLFDFDEFAIEDCLHPRQSPKLESFPNYHFFIVHGITAPADSHDQPGITCVTHELDGFLGDSYLVTYHDEPVAGVTNAKRHIAHQNSRLPRGTAYLAYEILDQLIDMYLPVMDYFEEKIRTGQQCMETRPFSAQQYVTLSTQILDLRRVAIKNQQVFYQFSHSSLQFVDPDEARVFRDIYDHTVRVVDMSDFYQQLLHGTLNIQFSLNTDRVNRVLQFLTVIATIIMPLNLITGVYGMNFEAMPLLHNPWGFWLTMALMLTIVITMLTRFKNRGWL
jgi:magnesium transporter